MILKEVPGLQGELNGNIRSSISSSVEPPDDIDGVLNRFPSDVAFIMSEMERLRTENAQKKMELDQMSITFKTAFALQKRNIINLQAEVKQLRGRIEEMTNGESAQSEMRRGMDTVSKHEGQGINSHERMQGAGLSNQIVLDLMSSDLALKNEKIKELETEVSQLRGRNGENEGGRSGRRRGEEDIAAEEKITSLPNVEEKKTNDSTPPVREPFPNTTVGFGGGQGLGFGGFRGSQENRGAGENDTNFSSPFEKVYELELRMRKELTSVVGIRIQGLLLGRKSMPVNGDREASVWSRHYLQQLAWDTDETMREKLSAFMKFPNFVCICGIKLQSGLAVIDHSNDEEHTNHRLNPVYQSDVNFWSGMLVKLRKGDTLPDV